MEQKEPPAITGGGEEDRKMGKRSGGIKRDESEGRKKTTTWGGERVGALGGGGSPKKREKKPATGQTKKREFPKAAFANEETCTITKVVTAGCTTGNQKTCFIMLDQIWEKHKDKGRAPH